MAKSSKYEQSEEDEEPSSGADEREGDDDADEEPSSDAEEREADDDEVDVDAVAPPPPTTPAQEQTARRLLGIGSAVGALGLALVGMGPSDTGTVLAVVGLLVLIYGIHTFGRLGPTPATLLPPLAASAGDRRNKPRK